MRFNQPGCLSGCHHLLNLLLRENWIVDPEEKYVQVFVLDGERYFVKGYGTDEDQMRVDVLEDCVIDLSAVFSE